MAQQGTTTSGELGGEQQSHCFSTPPQMSLKEWGKSGRNAPKILGRGRQQQSLCHCLCCSQELPGQRIFTKGVVHVCVHAGKLALISHQAQPEARLGARRWLMKLGVPAFICVSLVLFRN